MQKAISPGVGTYNLLHIINWVVLPIVLMFYLLLLTSPVSASLLSEEFSGDSSIKIGSIVSIDKDKPDSVTLSSTSNSEYILGVAINSKNSSVTFAKDKSKITIATSGETQVYVSDANGEIKQGDFIGASWLEGVGMKSMTGDRQKLLGIALEDFSATTATDYGDIKTDSGTKNIKVSTMLVRLFDKEGIPATLSANTGIEGTLSKVVGKDISTFKVFIGSTIFIISLIVAGLFISSSIKGSFTSVGRNPMASTSIYRSLLHVSGLSFLVIIIGTALSYTVMVI